MSVRGVSGERVVVTGAAGFIGSAVCDALIETGRSVLGIDAFTDSYNPDRKRSNVIALLESPRFELVEADLALADLRQLLDGADAVVHLAAEPRENASWNGLFARYVERNVLATQRLLEAAVTAGVGCFVYASSSSVYGEAANECDERAEPRPTTPYGVSKLAGEHLVALHADAGLSVVTLRYFSVFGPRQRPDMAVHRFVEQALDRKPFVLFGDGSEVRDFTFVDDAAAAVTNVLATPLRSGTVLNIAGGYRASMRELAQKVAELVGVDAVTVHQEFPQPHVSRRTASTATAAELLGWHPHVDLDSGLIRQIEWQMLRRRSRRSSPNHRPRTSARPHGARLMIYSQDGLGLGHLRRASSIATELLRREQAGWVLTTSDSPLGTLLRDVPNHDYLKLPSIVKAGPGNWQPLATPLDFSHLRQLRSRLILEAAEAFQPDVLLVDHMPHGAMGELVPTLEAARSGSARVVLGLRDIIDSPEVVRERWKTEGAYDVLREYYDDVLVYGSQSVYDIGAEYAWPEELEALVRYCGYLCTPDALDNPGQLRARRLAGMPRGALIVAMAGGGADAHDLMSSLLDALPMVLASRPCVLEIVTGPFMPDRQRLDLKARSRSLPVRIRTMVRGPLERLAAADLVVAMAGYNTTAEILRMGTPALLVPRRGPSLEQRLRARRFAERGWVSQLDPDDLTPQRLAGAMLEALEPAQHRMLPITPADLGGLNRAVEHLLFAAEAVRSSERRGLGFAPVGRSRMPGTARAQ